MQHDRGTAKRGGERERSVLANHRRGTIRRSCRGGVGERAGGGPIIDADTGVTARATPVRALTGSGRTAKVRPPGPIGRPRLLRRAFVLVLAAGLAVPIGFWWAQTPGSAVLGAPALLTSGGRLAGLTGGYLLLVQVALMSRVPWIDRAVGGARKSAWHRNLGGYVLGIISLHIVLITVGYAATARTGVRHEAWALLTTNQDMISAVVAFSMMLVLSVVAVRALRTRLPYGLWHGTHVLLYLVLLFVYGHQFADGQQFVLSHAARVYWGTLYVLVIVAVVAGRLVVPLRHALRYRLRVAAVVPEAPGVTSIYLTGDHLDRFPAVAGQHARWRFLTCRDWWRSHPYSFSAAPAANHLRLTVKASGDHSARLAGVRPGTRVLAEAPGGEFTANHRTRPRALLIGAGSGIAPIRALMETAPAGSLAVLRARTAEDLLFRTEVEKLAVHRKLGVRYVIGGRTSPDAVALTTPDGLRALATDLVERDVYVCGPPGLTVAIRDALLAARVPLAQIHTDPFEL